MGNVRIKSTVKKKVHKYPETFNTKDEALNFLKDQIPAPLIPDLIEQKLITIYQESTLIDPNTQEPAEKEL